EVGLTPVPLPEVKQKFRERLERLQKKSAKPLRPSERPGRNKPRQDGKPARPGRTEVAERPGDVKRTPRPQAEGPFEGEGKRPRPQADKRPARPQAGRTEKDKAKPAKPRPAVPAKRRSRPAGEGQRPGFGR